MHYMGQVSGSALQILASSIIRQQCGARMVQYVLSCADDDVVFTFTPELV